MAATAMRLGSVDVKGGLWGADLLAAIADDRTQLPADTIRADSYRLPARASTEQAARAAWTLLTAAWDEFTERHTAKVERDGTDTYGDDQFTLTTWVTHLLTQLGYSPKENPPGGLVIADLDAERGDGDWFSITHLHADQVPLHLLAAGVPLDTRTAGVAGAHRQSPHSLVQDYLNRTSKHLWAIVTNGLTLRILRDNAALSRQAYIEFDLAAIFADGAYADFALLWHAVHATRFTHGTDDNPADCIAERWQDHATATGVAALDDLRDGVEAAIAEIGQGLVEHPANTALRAALDNTDDPFDAAALYRELLYIAYRHVFWFTLDDRDLLHPTDADRTKVALYRDHYASTQLRTKARGHLGAHHPDGWQHFLTISSWFADPSGQPALDVPGLLGRLWEPEVTAHLGGATLTNRRYYEALRRLGYVTREGALQRINYDAMGSEELGAVYEALLEIRPTVDVSQRKFSLGRTSGSDRKKTGSYYTPTSLIKVLLDEALDPVLDERIKQAVHDLPADAAPDQRLLAREEAILNTTVCDPAMGSAHVLVAAGMRIAKRLAQLRTEEVEPSPGAVQRAFRDVGSRCLYGVDLNPMAVELSKVAIWLECHVPGQPLTFLDHHLKHGNALLGVGFDPDLIAWHRTAKTAADQQGVPDAAFKPLAGDYKAHARLLRDRNRQRRGGGGQLRLGAGTHHDRLDQLADDARRVSQLADDSPAALATKQRAWESYRQGPELTRQRLRADAWMASWTFPKTADASEPLAGSDPLAHDELPWDIYYDTFLDDSLDLDRPGICAVRDEAQRLGYFHWHLEFPDIAADGFGLMLGNPPWERVEVKQQEWFKAAGRDDVVETRTAALRKQMVADLETSDDPVDRSLFQQWRRAHRDAAAMSLFLRESGRYPYGGTGNVDTYAVFADHFAAATGGRMGIIAPSAILTGFIYRDFFAHLVDARRLAAAYDFENRRKLFPEVDSRFRFVTLIATAPGGADIARFAFMVHDPTELDDADRSYTLTPDEIALVNPNTKTAPVFLTSRDAEITTKIYERHPVLIRHGSEGGNPWGISFQRMFEVHDAGLFRTADELRRDGWALANKVFERGEERMFPLYEAKMFHSLNHRWATFLDSSNSRDVTDVELQDSEFEPLPRHWVPASEVTQRLSGRISDDGTLLAWRKITNATNERTCVAAMLPLVAANESCPLMFPRDGLPAQLLLAGTLSSFACDFVVRAKMTGSNLVYATMEQVAIPHPRSFTANAGWDSGISLGEWTSARVAALTATSHQMALELGLQAAIPWDRSQRELWRTELDAAMFHLFGYARDEVVYAMNTFSIIARKDRKADGLSETDPDWRTKVLILAKYDELAEHVQLESVYVSPDPPPLPERLQRAVVGRTSEA